MAEGMNPNERTNVVAKILQVLHQTSGSGEDPRRLEALAAEFERRTFESARSRQEYLQKIAIKLAKLKQKAEQEQRSATQTANVADPYVDGTRNSLQHMRSYSNSPANADQMAQQNYPVLSQADALYRQPPLQASTAGQNNQGIQQGYTAQHSRQTHQPNQSYKANAEQEMDDFAYMAKMFLDTDTGSGATGQGQKDQYSNFSGQMNAPYPAEPWVNSGGGGDQYTIVPEISGPSCLPSGGGGMQMGQRSSYPPIVGQATGQQGGDLQHPGQYQRQNSGSGAQPGMLFHQPGVQELRGEAMGSVVGASSDGKGHSTYEGSSNSSASYMKSIMALKHNIQLVWQKLQSVKNDNDKYRLQQILQNLVHQKSQLEGKQSVARQPATGQGSGMPLSGNTGGSNQPVVAQFTGVPTTENNNWVNNANELQRRYWALVYHLRDRYLVDLQDLRHKMSEKCSAHKLDPKTYERARKFIDCADAIIPLLSSSSEDPRFAGKGRTQQEFDQVNAIMKWLNSYQPLHAWQSQRAQFRQHWQSQAQMPAQPQTQLPTTALRTPATGPQPVAGKANAPKASQSSKPAAKRSRKADSASQQAGTMDEKSTEKPKKKPATTSGKAKASQAAKKNAPAVSKSKASNAQIVKPPPAPTFVPAETKTPAEAVPAVDECNDLSAQVGNAEKVARHYQAKMMGMAETASKEISSNIRSAFGENARMQLGPSSTGEAINPSHFIAANGLSNVSMHLYPPSTDCLRVSEQFLDSMESTKLNVSEVDGVHNDAAVDGVEATGDSAQTSANQENLMKKFDVADVARTEEGVDDGLGRKVYEGEHMTIIRSGDGSLVPLFESEKEPFKGYTAAKKMFGSEIAGQRGLNVQDMVSTWEKAVSAQKQIRAE
uniref:Mediator complex subunit 15 KIX domain-containing protein n=1 Tax=Picocystis salinarum TaxID=88271 RepID=A0A6U9RG44_9CHLO